MQPPYLLAGADIADDGGGDFQAVTQRGGFHVNYPVLLFLGEVADVLPAHVLMSFHVHLEAALNGRDPFVSGQWPNTPSRSSRCSGGFELAAWRRESGEIVKGRMEIGI